MSPRGQGTVTVKFLGDTSHFEKATDKIGGGLKKVGGGFSKMGKAAAVGFAAAGAAAIPFGIKAVQLASDVNESLSKVNTIFGKSGKEIDKWASGAATSLGLSRGAALDAAGSFGNMFTQLGIGAPKAAEMSKSIVGLAADFASFHNADISEVIDAQSAAFRGEYDSLQRFLPLINAANVEQKAMAMTGKASAKALTAQEKALAVNALMAEGAGEAVGDFARTSGGLANQLRILKARGENFMATVGQALLPLVLKALDLFGRLSAELKDRVAPVFDLLKRGMASFTESMEAGASTAGGFIGFMSRLGDTVGRVMTEIRGGIMAFRAAWKAADGDVTSSGFPGFMEKVANFIHDPFIPTIMSIAETVSAVFGKVAGFLDDHEAKYRDIFRKIIEVVTSAIGAVRAVIVTAVDFLRGVWRVFGDDIIRFAKEAWVSILEVVRGALNILTGVFDLIKAVLTGRWGDAWNALKKIVDGALDTIFGVLRAAVTNVIPTIFAGLGQILASTFRTAFDGLKGPFKAVLNWMIDRINDFVKVGLGPLALANKIPGLGSVIPDIPRVPHLAAGGTFRGAAVVGEAGPELLVGAGRVVPNNQLGGTTIINNFNAPMDRAGIARELEQILTDFVRQGGNLRFTNG